MIRQSIIFNGMNYENLLLPPGFFSFSHRCCSNHESKTHTYIQKVITDTNHYKKNKKHVISWLVSFGLVIKEVFNENLYATHTARR